MDLIADHITHRFGALDVLDDVSFTVGAGEVVAIVGPSGCGKSNAAVDSRRLAAAKRRLGAIAWRTAAGKLEPADLRVSGFCAVAVVHGRRECRIPLLHAALTLTARQSVVADALRRTSLTDFRGTYPKQLSGGMRQRVGIARALAVRPAILLMDEPLSALDSQTRELLMEDFIGLLADGSMGAVYVTHNLEEAVRLADRIVVLSRRPGRVREVVTIPMTRGERGGLQAREKLLSLQNDLWSLIREEAIDAEREVQHA